MQSPCAAAAALTPLALQVLVRALDASGVSDNLDIEVWSFHAPIETPHPLTLSPSSSPSSSLMCSRFARTAACCNGSHDMARAAAGAPAHKFNKNPPLNLFVVLWLLVRHVTTPARLLARGCWTASHGWWATWQRAFTPSNKRYFIFFCTRHGHPLLTHCCMELHFVFCDKLSALRAVPPWRCSFGSVKLGFNQCSRFFFSL